MLDWIISGIMRIAKFFNLAMEMKTGDIEMNPILKKDLAYHSRKFKLLINQTVYTIMLGIIFSIYYAATDAQNAQPTRNLGKGIFWTVASLQFVFAYFGPVRFAAESVAGEKERQTFDSLYLTLLTPKHIYAGKLFSSIGSLILLIICSFPFIALSIVMGGIATWEIFLAMGILLLLIFITGVIGVSCSILCKNVRQSHSWALTFLFIIPLIISIFAPIFNSAPTYFVIIGLYYFLSVLILYLLSVEKLKKI